MMGSFTVWTYSMICLLYSTQLVEMPVSCCCGFGKHLCPTNKFFFSLPSDKLCSCSNFMVWNQLQHEFLSLHAILLFPHEVSRLPCLGFHFASFNSIGSEEFYWSCRRTYHQTKEKQIKRTIFPLLASLAFQLEFGSIMESVNTKKRVTENKKSTIRSFFSHKCVCLSSCYWKFLTVLIPVTEWVVRGDGICSYSFEASWISGKSYSLYVPIFLVLPLYKCLCKDNSMSSFFI